MSRREGEIMEKEKRISGRREDMSDSQMNGGGERVLELEEKVGEEEVL